ncbi:hypothetical protein [Halomonas sp. BMC6]|uniref:hypothetical protein n=1 Tax=Halomonas sp. BMC6 TaxID=3073244 RepID=UPI0030D1ADE1
MPKLVSSPELSELAMKDRQLFKLKKPCANCPFRNDDQAIELAPGRLEDIASEITSGDGKAFFCHKTLSGERDDEYEEEGYYPGEKDAVCAGALAFQIKHGRIPIVARFAFMTGEAKVEDYEALFDRIISPEDVL